MITFILSNFCVNEGSLEECSYCTCNVLTLHTYHRSVYLFVCGKTNRSNCLLESQAVAVVCLCCIDLSVDHIHIYHMTYIKIIMTHMADESPVCTTEDKTWCGISSKKGKSMTMLCTVCHKMISKQTQDVEAMVA